MSAASARGSFKRRAFCPLTNNILQRCHACFLVVELFNLQTCLSYIRLKAPDPVFECQLLSSVAMGRISKSTCGLVPGADRHFQTRSKLPPFSLQPRPHITTRPKLFRQTLVHLLQQLHVCTVQRCTRWAQLLCWGSLQRYLFSSRVTCWFLRGLSQFAVLWAANCSSCHLYLKSFST